MLTNTPSMYEPYKLVSDGGDPLKNVAAAVAALAQHRRVALSRGGTSGDLLRAVITGTLTAGQASALIELAAVLGLPEDAVELRGYVADDELAGLYQTADLAFVASLIEGFSIPVAEAVAGGAPVV